MPVQMFCTSWYGGARVVSWEAGEAAKVCDRSSRNGYYETQLMAYTIDTTSRLNQMCWIFRF